MLDKFFKEVEDIEIQQEKETEKKERLEQQLQIDKLNKDTMELVREEMLYRKLQREQQLTKEEQVVVGRFYEDFSMENFKYCYVIVNSTDEGKALYFDKSGITYTVRVSEGVNKLLLGKGTKIKADEDIVLVKILTNYEL